MNNRIEIKVFDLLAKNSNKNQNDSKINSNLGKCQICLESNSSSNKIWNCKGCRNIFHLNCIIDWVKSIFDKNKTWECPICRFVYVSPTIEYYCFCGKTKDPERNNNNRNHAHLHSCGEICGRTDHPNRGKHCNHPCTSICHPGTCPQCNATIYVNCPCNAISYPIQCHQFEDRENIIPKCDNICYNLMNCGKHKCFRNCHFGECGTCKTIIGYKSCFCGRNTRDIICCESNEMGFSCKEKCMKLLSCNNHRCDSICHEGPCSICEHAPSIITTCFCGKNQINELISIPRALCTDPIPCCKSKCEKLLKCKESNSSSAKFHCCQHECHPPPCPPCSQSTTIKCQCGRQKEIIKCSDFDPSYIKKCHIICNRTLNCQKHKCQKICCKYHNKSHPGCQQTCSKLLNCNIHKCDMFCHFGPCSPCKSIVNVSISCACGAVIVRPPSSCANPFPKCANYCNIPCVNGHIDKHNCHSSFKSCPPCAALTQKKCVNNHTLVYNVACSISEVYCTTPCNRILPCGHKCSRFCHSGFCIDSNHQTCLQLCNLPLPCSHKCKEKCHPLKPCPSLPCQNIVIVKCKCKYRRFHTTCDDFFRLKLILIERNIEISSENFVFSCLPCDEICAVKMRNYNLAVALDIDDKDDPNFQMSDITFADFSKLLQIFDSETR